jgi:ribonuclease P protein component
MLGRTTLSGQREFKAVYAHGRRAASNGITTVALSAPGSPTKTGFAISSRQAGAVDRNRIRRRLREGLRCLRLPDGYWIVVKSDYSSARLPFQDLVGHLKRALEGAGVEGLPE